MAETRTIGFVGTGIMGVQMARRLAEAGHAVTAWNRTAEKARPLEQYGVALAGAAAETARGADAVIVMVSDGPTSDAVIFGENDDGLLAALDQGAVLLVMSSIPMETAARQGAAAAERGVLYLDAPVSGGEGGARDGTLAIMAGGDMQAFERMADIFAVLGGATHVGPAGAGSLAKLANQVIVGNTIATVAEALLLAEQGGADPAAVIEALKGGFADSPILQNHGRRMIAGDYKPGGPVRLQLKDTGSAEALGTSLGLTLPLTAQAREIYQSLADQGDQELDHNAAYLELRRRNGLA